MEISFTLSLDVMSSCNLHQWRNIGLPFSTMEISCNKRVLQERLVLRIRTETAPSTNGTARTGTKHIRLLGATRPPVDAGSNCTMSCWTVSSPTITPTALLPQNSSHRMPLPCSSSSHQSTSASGVVLPLASSRRNVHKQARQMLNTTRHIFLFRNILNSWMAP